MFLDEENEERSAQDDSPSIHGLTGKTGSARQEIPQNSSRNVSSVSTDETFSLATASPKATARRLRRDAEESCVESVHTVILPDNTTTVSFKCRTTASSPLACLGSIGSSGSRACKPNRVTMKTVAITTSCSCA